MQQVITLKTTALMALMDMVKQHQFRASFLWDRTIMVASFVGVIAQSLTICGMAVYNSVSGRHVTCAAPGNKNASGLGSHDMGYFEKYCYQHPPAGDKLWGLSNLIIIQYLLPTVLVVEALLLHLPYRIWSMTSGHTVRDNLRLIIQYSHAKYDPPPKPKEDITDNAQTAAPAPSGDDDEAKPLLSEGEMKSELQRRLKRWYMRNKLTKHYMIYHMVFVALAAGCAAFFWYCPGFTKADIRGDFDCSVQSFTLKCIIENEGVYKTVWLTNMSILTACIGIALMHTLYVVPYVYSCRCTNCKTKKCRKTCGKTCNAHYFQKVLNIKVEPKPRRKKKKLDDGTYEMIRDDNAELLQLIGTDYYSPRLADRYYLSHLCYANYSLLKGVIPDRTMANRANKGDGSDRIQSGMAGLMGKYEGQAESLVGGIQKK